MTEIPADGVSTPDPDEPSEPSLDALVGRWLTIPDVAERLALPLSAVRRLIDDRELLAWRVGERRILSVPELFLHEAVMRHLPGTFTVLADGGMGDAELLRWLFTPDPTLPAGDCPVEALAAGFKTEVRRRAMETAW